jgi:hypothetical protein
LSSEEHIASIVSHKLRPVWIQGDRNWSSPAVCRL